MPESTTGQVAVAEPPVVQTKAARVLSTEAKAPKRVAVHGFVRRAQSANPDARGDAERGLGLRGDGHELEALAIDSSAMDVLRACGGSAAEVERYVEALGSVREWLERPLWEMTAADADVYFGEFVGRREPAISADRAEALERFFGWLSGNEGAALLASRGLGPVRSPLDELNWPIPFGEG